MVEGRAGGCQALKGIAIGQTPLDDFFHRIDAIALDVVHQHAGSLPISDAADDILIHLVRISGTAGIVAVHVPVKILEAQIRHRSNQLLHVALIVAEPVGTAAGEAEHRGRERHLQNAQCRIHCSQGWRWFRQRNILYWDGRRLRCARHPIRDR